MALSRRPNATATTAAAAAAAAPAAPGSVKLCQQLDGIVPDVNRGI